MRQVEALKLSPMQLQGWETQLSQSGYQRCTAPANGWQLVKPM